MSAQTDFPDLIFLVDTNRGKGDRLLGLVTDEKKAGDFPYRRRYKAAPEHGVDWERVARAETHSLRVEILEALGAHGGSVLSPAELGRDLGHEVTGVAYHVRELEKKGLIKLVDSRPKRGALEHFYGLAGEE